MGLLPGCDSVDQSESEAASAQRAAFSRHEILASIDRETYDGYLLSIAERAPGFSGFYEEDGVLRVAVSQSVADPAAVASAALSAAESFAPSASPSPARKTSPVPAEARYDFPNVLVWREVLSRSTPGLSLRDADERKGVVYVEVASQSDVERVKRSANALGIPADAVEIGVAAPYQAATDIRYYGPYFEAGYGISTQTGGCTNGFIAYRGSAPGDVGGMVTNSHCTTWNDVVGGVNGAHFYQGTGSYGNSSRYLGVEIVDPPFNTSVPKTSGGSAKSLGLPVGGGGGRPWRYSDAAFIDFDLTANATNPLFGNIAKTEFAGTTGAGSLNRVNAFSIDSWAASSQQTVGTILQKVGRTTGWTSGAISRSCYDQQLDGTNLYNSNAGKDLRCQFEVQSYADLGDSGSPVFYSSNGTSARLHGVLWGVRPGYYVFSAINLVNVELRRSGSNGDLYTNEP